MTALAVAVFLTTLVVGAFVTFLFTDYSRDTDLVFTFFGRFSPWYAHQLVCHVGGLAFRFPECWAVVFVSVCQAFAIGQCCKVPWRLLLLLLLSLLLFRMPVSMT